MKNIAAAALIALGLCAGGFLAGGRYTMVASQGNAVARPDRFTGDVTMCVPGARGQACGFIMDPVPPALSAR